MLPIVLTLSDDDGRDFVENLYLTYRKKIYASAFKILNKREDAEDCVHDVIKTVITHLDTFKDASPQEIGKLLAVCTRNAAVNLYQKNKQRRSNESKLPLDCEYENELLREMNRSSDQNQPPSVITVREETKKQIAQMISELDDIYKDVLILQFRYKMNTHEIADILKISEGAVRVRLHRAKKILLQEKGDELDEIRKNGFL